jgi:hypothetical protein
MSIPIMGIPIPVHLVPHALHGLKQAIESIQNDIESAEANRKDRALGSGSYERMSPASYANLMRAKLATQNKLRVQIRGQLRGRNCPGISSGRT